MANLANLVANHPQQAVSDERGRQLRAPNVVQRAITSRWLAPVGRFE
jgi:hypothetical protein